MGWNARRKTKKSCFLRTPYRQFFFINLCLREFSEIPKKIYLFCWKKFSLLKGDGYADPYLVGKFFQNEMQKFKSPLRPQPLVKFFLLPGFLSLKIGKNGKNVSLKPTCFLTPRTLNHGFKHTQKDNGSLKGPALYRPFGFCLPHLLEGKQKTVEKWEEKVCSLATRGVHGCLLVWNAHPVFAQFSGQIL